MPKFLLSIVTSALLTSVSAQIFNAGFENNNGVPLSEWTMINVDGNTVASWAPVQAFNDEAWIQFYDFFDNKIAFSTSSYEGGGATNDWLITPLISIPEGGLPTLYWKAKSYDNTNADTYAVKISTTNQDVDSFEDLLVVEGEQAYEFNSRTLDLSAYVGQDIYLAFVNQTPSGYFLALDDVYISNSVDCYAPAVSTFTSSINVDNYLSGASNDISFNVSWDSLEGVTNYGLGVTTFDVPVTEDVVQEDTSKTFENVEFATRYQMFVKNSDCGSGWMGPKSIFTPSLLPYSHSFEPTEENYGEYDSDGWSSDSWIMGVNQDLAGGGAGYIYSNTSSASTNKWLYSYPILVKNEDGNIKVSLQANVETGVSTSLTLRMGLVNNTSLEPTIYQDFQITDGGYQNIEATFTDFQEGVNYVAIGNVTQNAGGYYALRIDNFNVTAENLSTDNYSSEKSLNIYPNPVANVLSIHNDSNIQRVEIFGIGGRLIKTALAKDKSITLNVSNLAKGVYVLKIYTNKGIKTNKFIKK